MSERLLGVLIRVEVLTNKDTYRAFLELGDEETLEELLARVDESVKRMVDCS